MYVNAKVRRGGAKFRNHIHYLNTYLLNIVDKYVHTYTVTILDWVLLSSSFCPGRCK